MRPGHHRAGRALTTVLPANLDDDLIELVDAQAAESGKSRAEVLGTALRLATVTSRA
ncbi:MAG: ribbon-helix-helix protein, CopG family [Nocardioidaceae bacterium]|nr:MAG: ribbon-helix-helix protein, CopG family [Nocardioidaceae bacterium]